MRCLVLKTITIEGKTVEPGEYTLDTITEPQPSIGDSPTRTIKGYNLVGANKKVLLTITNEQIIRLKDEGFIRLPTEPKSKTR